MFGFNSKIAGMVLVLAIASPAQAGSESVPNPGRVALLQQEAGRMMQRSQVSVSPGFGWIGVAFTVGIATSFLGTYFGLRRFAFGRLVERDGWREVTYRYRSSPVSLRSETLSRMTGVLEELERLGEKRSASQTLAIGTIAPPKPSPVTFARKGPRELTEPRPAASRAPLVPAPVPAPQPEDRYRRARRLLAEGLDLIRVQEMTGLKRAELDLVRESLAAARAGA